MGEKSKERIILGEQEVIKLINELREAVEWRDFIENIWPERMFQSPSESISLYIPRDWETRIHPLQREMTFEKLHLVPMISHKFDEIYGVEVSTLKENVKDIIERTQLTEIVFRTTIERGINRTCRGSYNLMSTWKTGYFYEFCDLSYLIGILTKKEGSTRYRMIKVQRPHLLEWYDLAKHENMKASTFPNRQAIVKYY